MGCGSRILPEAGAGVCVGARLEERRRGGGEDSRRRQRLLCPRLPVAERPEPRCYIFFAASLSFLPLFFTSPFICSRRPLAARSGSLFALPAVSLIAPEARSVLSDNGLSPPF